MGSFLVIPGLLSSQLLKLTPFNPQMQSHKVTTLQTLLLLVTLISAFPDNNRWSWSFFTNRQARAIENLHSGEHCVDVSTYEPVAFKDVTVEVCDSTFVKTCEDKTDQVSIDFG